MKKKNIKLGLIFIDFQKEYFKKGSPLEVPGVKEVLERAKTILNTARELKIPVFHVRHISKDPFDSTFRAGSSNVEFIKDVEPVEYEEVITKSRPGAFYLTELDGLLRQRGINTVAIVGLLSFMCVDTTARESHARGYDVFFIKDATASIDINGIPADRIHEIVCTIQGWLFSNVITTKELINFIKEI